MKITLLYNLKKKVKGKEVNDRYAEFDRIETINTLRAAIESRKNFHVYCIEADEKAYFKIKKLKPDFIFNIAEGLYGGSREAQIPLVLEMMDVPYSGSGPLCLSLCLDKVKTKEILLYHGIPTPKFQVFHDGKEKVDAGLKFPLICKLIHEGSSMGLSKASIVKNEKELRKQVEYLIEKYKQDVLVEEFIEGPEYSIGILGNGPTAVALPIIERFYLNPKEIALFEPDEAVIPLVKKMHKKYRFEKSVKGASRPARISKELYKKIENMALDSYNALNCNDWCRMEIRQNRKTKKLYVIELNPIAGIDQSYILPREAKLAGMTYADLINTMVDYAVERYGLKKKK